MKEKERKSREKGLRDGKGKRIKRKGRKKMWNRGRTGGKYRGTEKQRIRRKESDEKKRKKRRRTNIHGGIEEEERKQRKLEK